MYDVLQATPSITASGDGTADVATENKPNGHIPAEEMTSKDYYFDSYAHFGIHEVCWDIQEWCLLTTTHGCFSVSITILQLLAGKIFVFYFRKSILYSEKLILVWYLVSMKCFYLNFKQQLS